MNSTAILELFWYDKKKLSETIDNNMLHIFDSVIQKIIY